MMLSPLTHWLNMYGPVPMGFSTNAVPPPPVACNCFSECTAKEPKATLDGKATSAEQRVNLTVLSSTASIDLISPPYLQSTAAYLVSVAEAVCVIVLLAAGAAVSAVAAVAAGAAVGAAVVAGACVGAGAVVGAGTAVAAGAGAGAGAAAGWAQPASTPSSMTVTARALSNLNRFILNRFIWCLLLSLSKWKASTSTSRRCADPGSQADSSSCDSRPFSFNKHAGGGVAIPCRAERGFRAERRTSLFKDYHGTTLCGQTRDKRETKFIIERTRGGVK